MKTPQPWQRHALGALAILCLAMAIVGGLVMQNVSSGIVGVLTRLGLVLGTIWLAMPQLMKLRPMQSAGAWIIVLVLLLVCASRPNLFRVVASLLVVAGVIHWGLRWASILMGQGSEKSKSK